MATVRADFNAMNDEDHVRLGDLDAVESIAEQGVVEHDWVRLTDGELLIGARIARDSQGGFVGIPAWETLVYLDLEEAPPFSHVFSELAAILGRSERSRAEQSRALQLLTWCERLAPPVVADVLQSGYFPYRRASLLRESGRLELALLEIEEALRLSPGDPMYLSLQLELLRQVDLRVAVDRARRLVADDPSPRVLAACINVLADDLDRRDDSEFAGGYAELLDWIDRFQRAPGRDSIPLSIEKSVLYNSGLARLRHGDVAEAEADFATVRHLDPFDANVEKLMKLSAYDQEARRLAEQQRARPTILVA